MQIGVMGFTKLSLGMLIVAAGTTVSMAADTDAPSFPKPAAPLSDATTALAKTWASAPLGFTKALFVKGPASGFGQYEPRAASAFSADEVMHVYVEPVAFGLSEAEGTYSYALSAGFRLLNPTGQVLAENTDFARFENEARSPRRELSTSMSFQFSGLPAGEYTLALDITDQVSEKSAEILLPFAITSEDQQ